MGRERGSFMRDFDDSTLWRVSAFERKRGLGPLREGATLLPSTLMQELQQLERGRGDGADVLEVTAACMRQRESALLLLQHDGLVWPVTLFPLQHQYHSPRPLTQGGRTDLRDVRVIGVEPPGVRLPGHWMHERVAQADRYASLPTLLWALALQGPRRELLKEIGGTAAYRAVRDDSLPAIGALAPALQRLRTESVALRTIAGWPGMSLERASRLLNALYLNGALVVTRTHPAARAEPGSATRGWLGGVRRK